MTTPQQPKPRRERPLFWAWKNHIPYPVWDLKDVDLGDKNVHVGDTRYASKDGEVRVSTVFLQVDHNHCGSGPPILFETMVFGGEYGDHQWRYCTYEEAAKGHAKICEKVRGTL